MIIGPIVVGLSAATAYFIWRIVSPLYTFLAGLVDIPTDLGKKAWSAVGLASAVKGPEDSWNPWNLIWVIIVIALLGVAVAIFFHCKSRRVRSTHRHSVNSHWTAVASRSGSVV
ncbi:unnamed protein product [Allacma fusca]|uniref:Uncharacterized protein n=1 Tax=Allacma fusca TaxID=39272 RepID=A0A8J2PRR6_9HEXA|nr:unnamed protein product [Allacma fusca]